MGLRTELHAHHHIKRALHCYRKPDLHSHGHVHHLARRVLLLIPRVLDEPCRLKASAMALLPTPLSRGQTAKSVQVWPYSQLHCTVCVTNLTRSTKEGSDICFFRKECDRELTPEEAEETKRRRVRRGSNESKANR